MTEEAAQRQMVMGENHFRGQVLGHGDHLMECNNMSPAIPLEGLQQVTVTQKEMLRGPDSFPRREGLEE
jgi:hypothetical protein